MKTLFGDAKEERPSGGEWDHSIWSGVPAEVVRGFIQFWELYPRKVGKLEARRKFKAAMKDATPEAGIEGLRRWVQKWKDDRTEPEFVPHPKTWLHQGRYEDDLPAVRPERPRSARDSMDFGGSREWK